MSSTLKKDVVSNKKALKIKIHLNKTLGLIKFLNIYRNRLKSYNPHKSDDRVYDKFNEHMDQSPLGKIQQQYWTTKQQVIKFYSASIFFWINITH